MLKRLDHILNTPTKVAILRLLCSDLKWFTGRDIARRVGKGVANVHRALDELDAAGVVEVEVKPPVKLFRIAEAAPLVKRGLMPLFKSESDLDQRLWDRLAEAAGDDLVSMVLFGSRARGDAQPGSDVDVLVILRSRRASRRVRNVAFDLNSEHRLQINLLLVPVRELEESVREAPDLWGDIADHGRRLAGTNVSEVLRNVREDLAVAV